MILAGELVLTRNALLKKAAERDLDEMIALTERVDAITSELQDGVMATRMQPIGLVFTRFRRIVRDLAKQVGKEIELELVGEEVELDRTLIEALGDPLTHLIRNSADHGIELPERRLAAGKAKAGKLSLRAAHEAGQVVIQVVDDGAGIDPQKVAAVALKKGLYTAEQLRVMSTADKIRLIFAPGFSTAAEVTDLSGRGVGMDVVHSSLTKVGGTVDVQSVVGSGTTITVRLPLTLAIIPSVLVTVNDERYAIPQVNLVELVRVPGPEVQKRIERVGSASVMRLRGELLPLVRLTDVLGVEARFREKTSGDLVAERRQQLADRRSPDLLAPEPVPAAIQELRSGRDRRRDRQSAVNVVVVANGSFRYGIIVHQFLDSEEIVVKPLGSHFARNREYAGATILGDGSVALILDVAGLSAAANLSTAKSTIDALEARRAEVTLSRDAQTMLVVENAAGELFALPLGLVSRIERLRQEQVSSAGGRKTVTYDQRLLPLLAIEDVARVGPRPESPRSFAIVCRQGGREYGVLASKVVDVVDSLAPIDSATHVQPGILGSMVLDGQVVLLLDLHAIVTSLLPEYRSDRPAAAKGAEADRPPLVLVVEDSPFFRKQVVACLNEAGYETLAACDGEEGLAALDKNLDRVALVITDIEMPKLDGLSMTRKIRGERRLANLPILAVTSLSGEAAERLGQEAGLTEYLVKLDREQILERTHHYLDQHRAGLRAGH
jgi:two-component system chemotaxis sensor kinase CheA